MEGDKELMEQTKLNGVGLEGQHREVSMGRSNTKDL